MKSRREQQREATLEEIKDLAWQQMADNGPAKLSLRQITRQMRMSSAAIFRYFPNRDALLDTLTEDAFLSQDAALEASQEGNGHQSPERQLLALAEAYRQWAMDHPAQYMLIYGTPIPGYQPDWGRLLPAASRGLTLFLEIFESGRRAGQLTLPVDQLSPDLKRHLEGVISERDYPVSPQALYLAIAAWARLHGVVSLELIGQLGLVTGDPALFFRQEVDSLLATMTSKNP